MRCLILLLPIIALGCVHRPDYKPPAGHPALAGSTVSSPPIAADPFMVAARPIEPAPVQDKHHGDQDHPAGGMPNMPDEAESDHSGHDQPAPKKHEQHDLQKGGK